jgi:hypothetical protein
MDQAICDMSKLKENKASYKKHRNASVKKKQTSQFTATTTGSTISNRQIKQSTQYPIYECLISGNWKENGLAHLWIARKTPLAFIVGVYLVDIRCLGVKNIFIEVCRTKQEYGSIQIVLDWDTFNKPSRLGYIRS